MANLTANMIERCSATVRLNGSLLHTVRKKGITPAELVMLRREHGQDAVVEMEAERAEFPDGDERDRLVTVYGEKLFNACFPGDNVRLPRRFSQVGIQMAAETKKTKMLREAAAINTSMEDEEDQVDDPDSVSEEEMFGA